MLTNVLLDWYGMGGGVLMVSDLLYKNFIWIVVIVYVVVVLDEEEEFHINAPFM